MNKLVETVKSFLKHNNLTNKLLCLGFSGGYDSMCLLHVLHTIGANVIAVHLNHNWRGEESRLEEENCRKFCSDIGVIFYSETLADDIPHTETSAREARYKFFTRCMSRYGAEAFLTAHNADDNAETVLYRIVKGTGIDGLCGILSVREKFYRPLLSVYRADIEEYCRNNGLLPNIDSSNSDTKYMRNLIRHEIFPLLKKINPDALNAINSLSELAKEDCEAFNSDNLFCNDTIKFISSPPAFQGRTVKKLLTEAGLDYDRKRIDMVKDFIFDNKNSLSGKRMSVGSGLTLYVNSKYFKLIRDEREQESEIFVTSEGDYDFGDYVFSIQKCSKLPAKFPGDSEKIAYISIDNVEFTLRNRREGDYIFPLGLGGKQKLKKYLNEKKLPYYEKDKLVLLCRGNEVFWAAGCGISEKLKVIEKNVTHVLKLRKKGG